MIDERYDWISFDDDEEILWENDTTVSTAGGEILLGIALCLTLILSPLGVLVLVDAYMSLKNREYIVTNKKFYKKPDILDKNRNTVSLVNIRGLSSSQSFFGKQFNYGTINISNARGTMAFHNVKNPKELEPELEAIIEEHAPRYDP